MKIVFKRLDKSINLKKVYPVIEEIDYKLLQGASLIIPDSEYDKIQKKGFFDVGPFQISKDLIEIAQGTSYNPDEVAVLEEFKKDAVFLDDMAEVLFKAVSLGQNAIFYGRGGHNKSEGTELLLKLMKDKGMISADPFVLTCGDGMTEETLFGGINIKKFKESGELEFLFKNSFLEHEIVIFEEIFDAPPQVLLALKDVMTSKKARKGNQIHDCKTKVFIGLTNRSKADFSEDHSLEALAQRFPLTMKTEWDSYNKNNWNTLFKVVLNKKDPNFYDKNKSKLQELAEILQINNDQNDPAYFVSPRTAIHAAKLYCAGGNLKFISDINKSILDKYYKDNKDKEQDFADEEMFKTINEYIKVNELGEIDSNSKILDIILGEHKQRTGEDIQVEVDTETAKLKVKKLQYTLSLMDIHKWGAKNMDRASKKKAEIKDLISQTEIKEDKTNKEQK